ncbi:hypothetical protein [Candidatus Magnetaquiglobus chichijimensis]|uniref:hypothetical protein n=1 Tax=Candidatus Magnetaquiglobus chichijimensis TaxID=3141448 RepID=UPI003B9759C6
MKSLFSIAGNGLIDLFRSRSALQIKILALRHQLAILQRTQPRRLHIHLLDRLLWVLLSRIWQGWREALVIAKPETVIQLRFRIVKEHIQKGEVLIPLARCMKIRAMTTAGPSILSLIFVRIRLSVQRNPAAPSPNSRQRGQNRVG